MSYTKYITEEELNNWPEYDELWERGFSEHLIKKFPYIISVEYASHEDYSRILTFESEEHYYWFLLTR